MCGEVRSGACVCSVWFWGNVKTRHIRIARVLLGCQYFRFNPKKWSHFTLTTDHWLHVRSPVAFPTRTTSYRHLCFRPWKVWWSSLNKPHLQRHSGRADFEHPQDFDETKVCRTVRTSQRQYCMRGIHPSIIWKPNHLVVLPWTSYFRQDPSRRHWASSPLCGSYSS